MVLESWYYYQERGPAVFQEFAAQFQGIPNRVFVGYQFPRRRQRRSWRPGITPDTGVGVVLEAWCYTRTAGTGVIHVAATGFQGIPDYVARYKFPQNMVTTGSIPTAARGVDIQRALSSIRG